VTVIDQIRAFAPELVEFRRDIHAHPELGYREDRTADRVARQLAAYGVEVHRGLAKTGVVGTLRRGNSPRSIGLRAELDALPIAELNTFSHRSRHEGRMHACGHDGHATMLLGAARQLAAAGDFDGAVHFIFQPAEEAGAGADVMIK
jgi:amidohydrolase